MDVKEFFSLNRVDDCINKFYEEYDENETIEEIINKLRLFYNSFYLKTIKIGNLLTFRIRKISENEPHINIKDIWAPDIKYIKKIGRVNNIGESILYASFDPYTAIIETDLKENDEFSLAVFYLNADFNNKQSVLISKPNKTEKLNFKEEYSLVLSEFMIKEFTKKVPKNINNCKLYKVSCAISKLLLDTPYKDSIIYPSIVNKQKVNIAMLEDMAKNRFNFQRVLKCKLLKFIDENNALIEVSEIANHFNDEGALIYMPSYYTNQKIIINSNSDF